MDLELIFLFAGAFAGLGFIIETVRRENRHETFDRDILERVVTLEMELAAMKADLYDEQP